MGATTQPGDYGKHRPKPRRTAKRGPAYKQLGLPVQPLREYECGFCRHLYESDDYPSERHCPNCGRSEV